MTKALTDIECNRIYERAKIKIDNKLSKLVVNQTPKALYEPCSYILKSPGKRIRAFLVMLSAKAAGHEFSEVINAGAAVEILHNFTLVHDDIMDNADKRRGLKTLHVKYDTSTAILSGDNLIAIAYKNLLKDCNYKSKNVIRSFTNCIIEVCEGQSLDKLYEVKNNVSIKDYKLMIRKKTAALVEMCSSLGAEIFGADKILVDSLKQYGRNLGMAFQIQDDLLDLIGDEKEFGKSVGIDLIEGKKTFLFLKAIELSKGNDKKNLETFIENKGIKKNKIKDFYDLYLQLGVMDQSRKEVEKYTRRALKSLNNIDDDSTRQILTWLANMLLRRSK